jgi:hypothetical protein
LRRDARQDGAESLAAFRRGAVGSAALGPVDDDRIAFLAEDGLHPSHRDFEFALIDGTIVKVHRHGAGAKGGLKIRLSAGRAEG